MSEKPLNSEKTISTYDDKISHEVLKIFSLWESDIIIGKKSLNYLSYQHDLVYLHVSVFLSTGLKNYNLLKL